MPVCLNKAKQNRTKLKPYWLSLTLHEIGEDLGAWNKNDVPAIKMMNILRWKILGVTIRSCLLLLQSLKGGKDSLEPPYRGGDLGLVRLSTLFQITVPGVGVRWVTQPGFKFRLRWLHKHFASCRWWSTAMPSSVTLGSNATHDKCFQTFSGLILIPPSPHHLKPTAPQGHLFLSLFLF